MVVGSAWGFAGTAGAAQHTAGAPGHPQGQGHHSLAWENLPLRVQGPKVIGF